jgi:chemotaxis protein histidine kinase CheA
MTRESLAKAAQPPSKMEQLVLDIVGKHGPKPDFGVLVAAFMTIEPSLQEEFFGAVASHCGEDHATQLKAEIESATAAKAEAKAPEQEQAKAEEPAAPGPVAEETPTVQDEKASEPVAAPAEAVETKAPEEELVAVQEQVVEIVPEAVPKEAKEEIQTEQAAPEKTDEEQAQTTPADEVVEETAEKQTEESSGEVVAAAPDAAPEEKEQAADELKTEAAKNPEEVVGESESTESEEEVEAKQEEVSDQLDEEMTEQPDNAESMAALQALLAEAEDLIGIVEATLGDPILDTTEETLQADAEKLLARWDANVDKNTQKLQDMADRLTSGDLGQTPGTEDMVQAASDMAGELSARAESMAGSAPANVEVNVQTSDDVVNFTAPIGSRETAVADIVNMYLLVKPNAESEAKEEASEPAAADAPV